MKAQQKNIFLGIGTSVGLHLAVAAALLLGLSGNAAFPVTPGKLDLTWVSLTLKEKISLPVGGKNTGQKPSPVPQEMQRVLENARQKNEPVEIEAPASGTAIPAAAQPAQVSGIKNAAAGPAGSRSPGSDTRRETTATGAAPVFANAYPLYKENPPPGYPALARQQGYEGVVLVRAEILADGSVGRVLVSRTSGYAILDQSALRAVRGWKFEPARKAGVPCKAQADVPIKFELNDHRS